MHERGAPHVADPSKLVASAGRLYGDRMEELWGEVAPVDRERIHILEGGETIEDTFEVTYTPGHASHHVSYLDTSTGEAYVGDTAGVRVAAARVRDPAHAAAGHRRGPVAATRSGWSRRWAPPP